MEANGQTIGRHTRVLSVVACALVSSFTVYTSFTWAILFALTFDSFFLPAPTHALFTLASFRILSTDWRPFKRARATRHFLSILPSDAYKAGHVLLIIDYLIGMESSWMVVTYILYVFIIQ